MNKLKIILGLLLLSQVSFAQKLTIRQAAQKAVDESKALKIDQNRIEMAEANVQTVKNSRLPDINASGQFMYLPISPNVKLYSSQSSSSSTSSSSGSASTMPNPKSVAFGQLAASYPIFTGFRLKTNLEKANQNVTLSKLSSDLNAENVVWQTVQLYISILRANEVTKALRANIAKSESRIEDYNNFLKNGIVTENDLMKVKLQKSNIQLSLDETLSNIESEKFRFNTYLNLDPKTPVDFDISDQVLKTSNDFSSSEKDRKDMAILDKKIEISKFGIALAKANYYPSIALTAGYIAANINNFVTITNAYNVGVGFKYNIASLYKNKTEMALAKMQIKDAEYQKQQAADNAKIEINETINKFELSKKRTTVMNETKIQADENFRIVNDKFKNGIANTDDLLEADFQQLQADINHRISKGNQQLTWYAILNANGTLLDYLNIKK